MINDWLFEIIVTKLDPIMIDAENKIAEKLLNSLKSEENIKDEEWDKFKNS